MFKLKHLHLDTLREHVIVIHERAVREGNLGFNPLDRAHVIGIDPISGQTRSITGVLNVCRNAIINPAEIGVSEQAFRDLGLPEDAPVQATLAVAPPSVDLVRAKLAGRRLGRADFEAILSDVVEHRYSRVELSMFVLACALKKLELGELVDYTQAMIGSGLSMSFGAGPVIDKHCIGGIPGNRVTMIVVPIVAAQGITFPKTSSRAITSPAGTADTMGVLANVELGPERMYDVVRRTHGCIAWGGALRLAPADDILITVERPMELDTEAQMVASILAKKKTAGATHVLIDIPVGPTAKVRSRSRAQRLAVLFRAVAEQIGLQLEVEITQAWGPIGRGIGPRLEALDVLSVLRGDRDAPSDLREKSLFLASRILEISGMVSPNTGYRVALRTLEGGAAYEAFQRIIEAQGRREILAQAPYRCLVKAPGDGRIRHVDCWEIARVAKLAGAPANHTAGVRLLRNVGEIVSRDEPIFEIHAESEAQLEFARSYAGLHPIFEYGF